MRLLDLKTEHRWAVGNSLGDPKTVVVESLPAWMVAFLWLWVKPPFPLFPILYTQFLPEALRLCAVGVESHTTDTRVKVQWPFLSFLLWGNINNQQARLWRSLISFWNSCSYEDGGCFVQGLLLYNIQTPAKPNFLGLLYIQVTV